jgi:hypothetical protein
VKAQPFGECRQPLAKGTIPSQEVLLAQELPPRHIGQPMALDTGGFGFYAVGADAIPARSEAGRFHSGLVHMKMRNSRLRAFSAKRSDQKVTKTPRKSAGMDNNVSYPVSISH